VALMTPNKPTVVLSQPPVNVDHGLPKLAGVIQRLHRTGRGQAVAILLSSTGSGDPMLLSLDRPVTPAQRQAIRWQTRDAHLEHAAGTSKTRLIPHHCFLGGMSRPMLN
jgi:hypothetical protein